MNKKATIEEMNEGLSTKVDFNMLRNGLDTKANTNDIDGVRRALERVLKEIEYKSSFQDLEGHISFTKNVMEDINKELLLKASIKDVCTLLD